MLGHCVENYHSRNKKSSMVLKELAYRAGGRTKLAEQ
jgi:hypothetical protein